MRYPCIDCNYDKTECVKCVEKLALERNDFKHQLEDAQDKLHRRNLQIKDLKAVIQARLPQDRPSAFRKQENQKVIDLVNKFIVGTNSTVYEKVTQALKLLEEANECL